MSGVLPLPSMTRVARLKQHWVDRLAHGIVALIALVLVAFLPF